MTATDDRDWRAELAGVDAAVSRHLAGLATYEAQFADLLRDELPASAGVSVPDLAPAHRLDEITALAEAAIQTAAAAEAAHAAWRETARGWPPAAV